LATILLAVAVQCAPDEGNSAFLTVKNAYRRAYSSGGSGNTGSGNTGSGYSSGAGGAGKGGGGSPSPPTPTAQWNAPIQITQRTTLDITSAAAYTGDLKTVCEVGVGIVYGIYSPTKAAYETGCSMASTVVTRRADVVVEFTATVSAAKARSADSAAQGMTATSLTAALAQAKTATGKTSVTLPTVKSVANPTIRANTTASGVSSTFSMCMYTLFASVVALLYRH